MYICTKSANLFPNSHPQEEKVSIPEEHPLCSALALAEMGSLLLWNWLWAGCKNRYWLVDQIVWFSDGYHRCSIEMSIEGTHGYSHSRMAISMTIPHGQDFDCRIYMSFHVSRAIFKYEVHCLWDMIWYDCHWPIAFCKDSLDIHLGILEYTHTLPWNTASKMCRHGMICQLAKFIWRPGFSPTSFKHAIAVPGAESVPLVTGLPANPRFSMVASETLCLRSEMSFFGAGCRTASSSWCSLLPNLEFFIEVF